MTFPGAIPTLTDGPVTLRAHRPSDVERSVEQSVDAESVRWTTVPTPYSLDDARDYIGSRARAWLEDTEWPFAVEVDRRFGGSVELRNEGPGRAEVAFGSHPDIRGTGAMERALRLLLAWGFEARSLTTVIWWAHAGNWASRKLAWKVGFSFDGCVRQWLPQRGEMRDAWVGTLLASEPLQPREAWEIAADR
ncbi:Protein N-acetyltransferase, RimJ/RimL family [Nocardioides terrae]|uniref:Protein N-acetyltransferase, RimJ/RimL family n=1 Tax=Nocardioides terrae TaxID=574651 RepID=A0A1I1LM42_9ACTN|nr:GNAT family protein [Nocardioides terrae]SFC73622.1 Protein N-acetyltransferase, RimJ/RimL family [Nocardioides terrae]